MSVPTQFLTQRLANWQKDLPEKVIVLFSNPADIAYFTGFGFLLPAEREAFLVVSTTKATLWYTSFSPLPKEMAISAEPMFGLQTIINALKAEAELGNIDEVRFDPTDLTIAEHDLMLQIPDVSLTTLNRERVWQLRTVKDEFERLALAKAGQITSQVVEKIIQKLKPGQTETEIAWELEKTLRETGSENLAFPTIVAFGANTALPHHQPTNQQLTADSAVLIDVGGKFENYCADMTRSFWFGPNPPAEYQKIQTVVHTAYNSTVAWMTEEMNQNRPISAKEIDEQTRKTITEAGFGKQFIHTTGHGVGLEIHEPPSLSWRNEANLPQNVCLTIEPGIYLTGLFGYRYENTLQLQAGKITSLTEANSAKLG